MLGSAERTSFPPKRVTDYRKILLFILFNIVLTAVDVGTDVYSAATYFSNGHWYWGASTLTLVFLPFIIALLARSFNYIPRLVEKLKNPYALDLDPEHWISQCDPDNPSNNNPWVIRNQVANSSFKSRVMRRWNSAWWDLPIWYLPFLQLVNHARYSRLLSSALDEVRKKKAFFEASLNSSDQDIRIRVSDEASKHLEYAKQELSELEANILKSKLMESVFESGPQYVLQLSILLKTGQLETHQTVTMLVSLVSFWLSTTSFYLAMPTKSTPLREKYWKDFVILFLPSMFVVVSRLATWSFILAYLEAGTIAVIVVAVCVQLMTLMKKHGLTKDNDFTVIGAFVTVLTPCVAQDEYSRFYIDSTVYSSVVIMSGMAMTLVANPSIDSDPPIFTCFDVNDATEWTPNPDQIRCFFNRTMNLIENNCNSVWILHGEPDVASHDFRTICHPGVLKEKYLLICLGILYFLQLLSFFFGYLVLQPYLNPVTRLEWSSNLKMPIWNTFYQVSSENALELLDIERGCQDNIQFLMSMLKKTLSDNIVPLVSKCFSLLQDLPDIDFIDHLSTVSSQGNSDSMLLFFEFLNNKVRDPRELVKQLEEPKVVSGMPPIIEACRNHNVETIKVLLEQYELLCDSQDHTRLRDKFMNLYFYDPNQTRNSLIHVTAARDEPSVVNFILEKYGEAYKKLDNRKIEKQGWTEQELKKDSLRGILAYLTIANSSGRTALFEAGENGDTRMMAEYVKCFQKYTRQLFRLEHQGLAKRDIEVMVLEETLVQLVEQLELFQSYQYLSYTDYQKLFLWIHVREWLVQVKHFSSMHQSLIENLATLEKVNDKDETLLHLSSSGNTSYREVSSIILQKYEALTRILIKVEKPELSDNQVAIQQVLRTFRFFVQHDKLGSNILNRGRISGIQMLVLHQHSLLCNKLFHLLTNQSRGEVEHRTVSDLEDLTLGFLEHHDKDGIGVIAQGIAAKPDILDKILDHHNDITINLFQLQNPVPVSEKELLKRRLHFLESTNANKENVLKQSIDIKADKGPGDFLKTYQQTITKLAALEHPGWTDSKIEQEYLTRLVEFLERPNISGESVIAYCQRKMPEECYDLFAQTHMDNIVKRYEKARGRLFT